MHKIGKFINSKYYYFYLKKLISISQYWPKKKLNRLQLILLKRIVKYVWENVEGYRQLWAENNFYPSKLKSLEDINLIPIIKKDTLRSNIELFTNQKIRNKFVVSTGGSTGIPLKFFRNNGNNACERAFILDIWKQRFNSIRNKSRRTSLRGEKIDSYYEINDRGDLILSSYSLKENNITNYIQLIEKYKTPILHAYPSMAYRLAKLIDVNNLKIKHHFDLVALGSEKLFDFQKELIQKILSENITHWYGLAERVSLGGYCRYNDTFHIYPQHGLTQILDKNDEQVKVGEKGEIIGTGFWNFATPLIRYRTSDIAIYQNDFCKNCKKNYLILKKIEGRKQEYFIDFNNNQVTCTGYSYLMKYFDNVEDSQFVQNDIGIVTLRIKKSNKYSKNDERKIQIALNKMYKGDINFLINYVDKIERKNSNKNNYVVQNLKI